MLFTARFTDKPGCAALRAEHLAAHVRWLGEHADTILAAGTLRDTADAVPLGGLWLLQADSKEAIHALIETDPFTLCGLRQQVEVLHWHRAFPEGKVTL